MLPTLRPDDWVQVGSPVLKLGQIIVVVSHSQLIAHRIALIEGAGALNRVWTRGDNMPYCDPPWRPDQIIGAVTRIIRPEGDFAPDNRITLKLRLRWAYLTMRWYAGRVYRKLVRTVGLHRSLSSSHDGVPTGEAATATLAETVEPAAGPGLRGQAAAASLESGPDRSSDTP